MKSLTYSLKVWLTGVLVGTTIWCVIGTLMEHSDMSLIASILVATVYAFLYSGVSFLLSWAAVTILNRGRRSKNNQRSILTALGIILTAAPFFILFGAHQPNWLALAGMYGCYIVPIIIGTWLYKLPI